VKMLADKKAAEKAKFQAEVAKISDNEAVVSHNNKILSTVKPMRSKQLDAGVTKKEDADYDILKREASDAMTERYTLHQQKSHGANITELKKLISGKDTTDADKLEAQAKLATVERQIGAQVKAKSQAQVKSISSSKKQSKAERKALAKQRKQETQKQLSLLKKQQQELLEKQAKTEQ